MSKSAKAKVANRKWMRERYRRPGDDAYRAKIIAYQKQYHAKLMRDPKRKAAWLKRMREAARARRAKPGMAVRLNRKAFEWMLNRWLASRGWSKAYYCKMVKRGCAICKKKRKKLKGRAYLVKDHNHKTGKARGLLCPNCNRMIGWYEARRKVIEAYVDS